MADFELNPMDLRLNAVEATALRKQFHNRAKSLKQDGEVPSSQDNNTRQRKGLKYSTRNHNPDGKSEAEHRQAELRGAWGVRKFKKRTLKQLSMADRAGILCDALTG